MLIIRQIAISVALTVANIGSLRLDGILDNICCNIVDDLIDYFYVRAKALRLLN
ncbi:MAG: hypothetical protein GXP08_16060 [Gammaproteobacteria bacterium]|nr:hypothetical protein [Gammaproteobacteria bacterium]